MSTSLQGPSGPEKKRARLGVQPQPSRDAKLVEKRSHCISKNSIVLQSQKQGFTGHLQRLGDLVIELSATVLEAVQIHCEAGCTSREIAALTGLRGHVVAPRLSELQSAGRIAKIGKKWDSATERSNALFAATGGAS